MATTHEKGACSKVHLTLHVPSGRTRPMRKLLKPSLRPADPSLSLLHVLESPSPVLLSDLRPRTDIPRYSVGAEVLTTPALSLMTFLPEDGSAEEARERLRSFPWKFHHRIELQTSPSGGSGSSCLLSGKQEFYSLSRQYPLCSVCPSPSSGSSTVRFNLFVKNYRAMVEFYRLLADSEMESSKADFALFSLNTSDGQFCSFASSFVSSSSSLSSSSRRSSSSSSSSSPVKIPHSSSSSPFSSSSSSSGSSPTLACCVQLALKHCPYLDPYPLSSAYLTCLVRNMTALRTVLPGKTVELSPNTHLVRDPDGNCVIVHDVQPPFPSLPGPHRPLLSSPFSSSKLSKSKSRSSCNTHGQAIVSRKTSSQGSSCCESQDSGRFSDSERGSSELDQCLERLVREVKEVQLNITDYSESSDTDSDDLDVSDSETCCGGLASCCCSNPVIGDPVGNRCSHGVHLGPVDKLCSDAMHHEEKHCSNPVIGDPVDSRCFDGVYLGPVDKHCSDAVRYGGKRCSNPTQRGSVDIDCADQLHRNFGGKCCSNPVHLGHVDKQCSDAVRHWVKHCSNPVHLDPVGKHCSDAVLGVAVNNDTLHKGPVDKECSNPVDEGPVGCMGCGGGGRKVRIGGLGTIQHGKKTMVYL